MAIHKTPDDILAAKAGAVLEGDGRNYNTEFVSEDFAELFAFLREAGIELDPETQKEMTKKLSEISYAMEEGRGSHIEVNEPEEPDNPVLDPEILAALEEAKKKEFVEKTVREVGAVGALHGAMWENRYLTDVAKEAEEAFDRGEAAGKDSVFGELLADIGEALPLGVKGGETVEEPFAPLSFSAAEITAVSRGSANGRG